MGGEELLREGRGEGAGGGGVTNTPDSVNVVLRSVREGHIDDVGQAGDVDPPGSRIGANQKADLAILERLQPCNFDSHLLLQIRSRSSPSLKAWV